MLETRTGLKSPAVKEQAFPVLRRFLDIICQVHNSESYSQLANNRNGLAQNFVVAQKQTGYYQAAFLQLHN